MSFLRPAIGISVILLLLPASALAQIEVGDTFGTTTDRVGQQVCILDDVDGDGNSDWATSGGDSTGPAPGFVRVLSGATNAVIHELFSNRADDNYGHSLSSTGDLNGDGLPELLITRGVGAARVVDVISTGTWSVLRTIPAEPTANIGSFGDRLAGLGDLTGDGVDDFAISDFNLVDFTRVWVYDGATGVLVYTLNSPRVAVEDFFGASIASVGDLDGDGLVETLVGAPRTVVFQIPGAAYVYRGSDGSLFRTHDKFTPGLNLVDEEFGSTVVATGDVDGDGVGDYAISSEFPTRGRVRLSSGASGAVLHQWLPAKSGRGTDPRRDRGRRPG